MFGDRIRPFGDVFSLVNSRTRLHLLNDNSSLSTRQVTVMFNAKCAWRPIQIISVDWEA